MKSLLLVLIVACMLFFSIPVSATTSSTGYKLTMLQSGVHSWAATLEPDIQAALQGLKLSDINSWQNIKIGNVTYTIDNFVLNTLTLGPFSTSTRKTDQDFEFNLHDAHGVATFNWHYKDVKFPYTSDSGHGTAQVKDCTVLVHIGVERTDAGTPHGVVTDCLVNINSMDVTLDGGKYSWLYQALIDACKDTVIRHVQDDLVKAANVQIQRVVNSRLAKWDPFFEIDSVAYFDEILDHETSGAYFGDNYMTFRMNGLTSPSKKPLPLAAPEMPDIVNNKALQLMFTNEAFQTWLNTHRSGHVFTQTISQTNVDPKLLMFLKADTYKGLVPWFDEAHSGKVFSVNLTVVNSIVTKVMPAAVSVETTVIVSIIVDETTPVTLSIDLTLAMYPGVTTGTQALTPSFKYYKDVVTDVKSEGPIETDHLVGPLKILYSKGVVPWLERWAAASAMPLPPVDGLQYSNATVTYNEAFAFVAIGCDFCNVIP
ncbi:LBP / BPI / CETP family, N-terminal domain [Carpediemonas membranifera]|uniref:LBP / BPI / CETP family, N-terminal domain n=1 Tax=Carpediemonas membranifera TaxID=201153 RepID=A0A8J6B8K4_9EUKA|nr:LBP / BPI / CETP family, N-terminal domain [Carpediemonas membranifera]|eukprot:KAG9396484.1 LBP / BPI / CETP family, N-terminal domain [Carpediemonas membranifera]